MDYIPNTEDDKEEMLKSIGVKSIKELFKDVPEEKILKENLRVPKGLSEIEVKKLVTKLSQKNNTDLKLFRGAGSYNHFIPSIVPHLIMRSEFYTAYTPYQPEISQGILQAIFEYQTMICELTGMDVANASLYDGGSACAEAAMIASRVTRKKKIIVSDTLNPEYKEVLKTYLDSADIEFVEVKNKNGVIDTDILCEALDDDTAGVIISNPNFFGNIEDLEKIEKIVHIKNCLLISCMSDATSLGLLKQPGEYVDIVVGEGQPFGNPMNFGGPYLGIIATKEKYMRQMPGRIVGETVDATGERGYVLTLQAREQHIRRCGATSNICSNEALCALAATVYLSAIGKKLKELANLNLQKANYCFEQLKQAGLDPKFSSPFYNEFVLVCSDAKKLNEELLKNDIVGGLELEKYYPDMKNCLLFCVTEMNTREDIDKMVEVVKKVS